MNAISPPILLSLFDQQYALLRNLIIRGVLPPESLIRPEVLTSTIMAGKAFFRIAFLRLEQEGLIELSRRSARVRPLLREEFDEICEMRLAIEPGAVVRSRKMMKGCEAGAIMTAHRRLDQSVKSGCADAHEVFRFFNLLFIARTKSPITFLHLKHLYIVTERYLEHQGEKAYGYLAREKVDAWVAGDLSSLYEIARQQIIASNATSISAPRMSD